MKIEIDVSSDFEVNYPKALDAGLDNVYITIGELVILMNMSQAQQLSLSLKKEID